MKRKLRKAVNDPIHLIFSSEFLHEGSTIFCKIYTVNGIYYAEVRDYPKANEKNTAPKSQQTKVA